MEEKTMEEKIVSLASALTEAKEEESELLRLLCAAQSEVLASSLRAGITKEDCAGAFICAAAFLGAAALAAARNGGGEEVSSLRAGDVTITKRAAGENGERLGALREQAWALMRPYTKDGGFCFCGVQG